MEKSYLTLLTVYEEVASHKSLQAAV